MIHRALLTSQSSTCRSNIDSIIVRLRRRFADRETKFSVRDRHWRRLDLYFDQQHKKRCVILRFLFNLLRLVFAVGVLQCNISLDHQHKTVVSCYIYMQKNCSLYCYSVCLFVRPDTVNEELAD